MIDNSWINSPTVSFAMLLMYLPMVLLMLSLGSWWLAALFGALTVNELLLFEWQMNPERYEHLPKGTLLTALLGLALVWIMAVTSIYG